MSQQQQQQQPPPGSQQHGGGAGGGGMGHPQYGMHPNQSPYGHVPHQQQQQQPPPQHGQPSVMNSNKMNGDGRGDMGGVPPGGGGSGNMNVNSNQKPLPQRGVRQYAPQNATDNALAITIMLNTFFCVWIGVSGVCVI